MKHIVHVTVTLSIEVDDDFMKAEYDTKLGKKQILEHAIQHADYSKSFDTKAVIFESYEDKEVKARRGVGSY